MEFLTKYNLTPGKVFKIAGLLLLVVLVLSVGFRLIGSSINSVSVGHNKTISNSVPQSTGLMSGGSTGLGLSASSLDLFGESDESIGLSARNVASTPSSAQPDNTKVTTGNNAEDMEVTEYRATIETRQLKNTCKTIADLKAKDYVIFENAQESDESCNYTFKVKRENAEEVLGIIKNLKPKDISESTYTIKKLVDDYTSEEEILKNKLASIDETLTKATVAYDNITSLATRVEDVESLAKIITSKIAIIERLTQERINVSSQLERLGRSKAEQLDKLEYVYFYTNVYENKFFDWQTIKDSWKYEIKGFVNDINKIAQNVSINFAAFILVIIQYALYIFVLLLCAKYGWKAIKYIWTK
jgi:hypothetical protein